MIGFLEEHSDDVPGIRMITPLVAFLSLSDAVTNTYLERLKHVPAVETGRTGGLAAN